VLHTPSSDGVEMGIEGTIYFTLNLDPNAMRSFDTKFGNRQFRVRTGSYATPTTATKDGAASSTRWCGR
jgi:hypothetical protein